MANMVIEAKRVKKGNALTQFQATAENAINQLTAIKAQLLDLRAAVEGDADFTNDDIAVVNQVITSLQAQLATL